MRFCMSSLLLVCLMIPCPAAALLAQDDEISEMELIERVAELQHQLESPQVVERDEAEKELLNLGTDYYQFVDVAVPAVPTLVTPLYWVLVGLVLGCGGLAMRVRSR